MQILGFIVTLVAPLAAYGTHVVALRVSGSCAPFFAQDSGLDVAGIEHSAVQVSETRN